MVNDDEGTLTLTLWQSHGRSLGDDTSLLRAPSIINLSQSPASLIPFVAVNLW